MLFHRAKTELVTADRALPGRAAPGYALTEPHTVLGHPLTGPYPDGLEVADFGLGCFWGAEKVFWQLPGVWTTLVGYQGGHTPNPTYEEVCSGQTGHTEAVRVVFDPSVISYPSLLKAFWEAHDPTQGHRQGNDVGTQYRSAAYTHSAAQLAAAEAARDAFQPNLTALGLGPITTEIAPAGPFYPAEPYHQQYLSDAKNPSGYCGLGGTGAACPIGVARTTG
ncbi:peptide-methionine (S)-S-oxide reductase MsrA [Kitasatospora nipponensis]|uniref:Peptide methionine sulfoxide reductase MsrA n=1 Tax=Kitasatospora nipponensis TaxID=258049 RepID=A0ABN1W134_9ACTN